MVYVELQLATVMFAGMIPHHIMMYIVPIMVMIMMLLIIIVVMGPVFVPVVHIPPPPMAKIMIVMGPATKRLACRPCMVAQTRATAAIHALHTLTVCAREYTTRGRASQIAPPGGLRPIAHTPQAAART